MSATITKTTLRSDDFTCPSCVGSIESYVGNLPGVASVKVHFSTGRIVVEHDAEKVPATSLVETIGGLGYKARLAAF